MSQTRKTTTMHLYPEEYSVIKDLSVNTGLPIPDAMAIIIQLFVALVKQLKTDFDTPQHEVKGGT